MTEKRMSKGKWIIFTIMLLTQLLMLLIIASGKYGYHVDEIFTYGMANNFYKSYLFKEQLSNDINNEIFNHWIPGEKFAQYIMVGESERFRYDSVYYNQTTDSHPPVYGFIMHTLSSIYPNTFTKWTGIGLNIALFLFCQMILFSLLLKMQLSFEIALLTGLFWGFGIGAVNNVLLIRMYVLLTFLVILFTFLHIRMINRKRQTIFDLAAVFSIALIGFLTHYYFIVYAFFAALFYFGFLLAKKRIRAAIPYSLVMLGSLLSFLALFPSVLTQLQSSMRGSDAVESLVDGNLLTNFSLIVTILLQEVFGMGFLGEPIILVILWLAYISFMLFLIYLLIRFLIRENNKKEPIKLSELIKIVYSRINTYRIDKSKVVWIWLFAIQICFILVVSQIAPPMGVYFDRYIFCIFPFFALLGILMLQAINNHRVMRPLRQKISLLLQRMNNHRTRTNDESRLSRILAFISVLLLLVIGHLTNGYKYQYPVTDDRVNLYQVLEGVDCVYITPEDYLIHANTLEFMQTRNVFPTRVADLAKQMGHINENDQAKELILLINERLNPIPIINTFKTESRFNKIEFLFMVSHYERFFVMRLSSESE